MLYLLFQYLAQSWWNTWLSPSSSQNMLTGWGCRRKGTCRTILPRAVFRSTLWPILHSTLVLALKGLLQVLSCKRLFLQLTGDIKSLEQLPHQQGQEKGGTRLRHSIYHFKFSCYFPLHRGGGRWGSLWPSLCLWWHLGHQCSDLGLGWKEEHQRPL